jgi:uncharacterized membrane protein YoaK (UPF0700 family)
VSVTHRLGRADADRLHLALMLALTFSTGVVDAVGYLGLDRVFTGNMTGNVVLLGMALTGTTTLPVLRPLLALGFFLAGAVVSSRIVRRQDGWSGRVTVTLWVIISAGAAAGALALLVHVSLGVLLSAAITIVVASLGHTGHRARAEAQAAPSA